jgi:RNA polymerase sigma-70 factor (ECF subfamily)
MRPVSAVDEPLLLEKAPCDGQQGFASVVDAHWEAVFRLLFAMSGNSHDAEELTQETFLRAFRRWESYQAGTNVRAWLLRIATNAWLDVRRRRQRARSVPLDDDLPGKAAPPGRRLELAEQGEMFQAALEELSETARVVFHLRVQESLSFREIAGLLESTEQAVRWHMHQARTRLLARMEP